MRKLSILILGVMLFIVACNSSVTEEKNNESPPTEDKNSTQTTEEVSETNSNESVKKEMSSLDAIYYLEQITRDYVKISYHDVFNEETSELLKKAIDNAGSTVDKMEEKHNSNDVLMGEVKEIANVVIKVSEDIISSDGNPDVTSDGSHEIGVLIGDISRDYLNNKLPPTMDSVLKEFGTHPDQISEIAEEDFFSNEENAEFYKNALNKANYKEIYDKVTSYINDNDISDYDSANEIIKILEPIQDFMDEVEIEYDDFDDVSTIYYQGLTDISSENYIVPFITTNDNNMNFLVGFEKNGWLFADDVVLNIDGERESFGTFDFDRDTLGGSMIQEKDIKTHYDEELVKKLIKAEEVKMRFEGDKGNLDYTLTDTDIEAIKTIHSFNGIRNELSNLLFRYEDN